MRILIHSIFVLLLSMSLAYGADVQYVTDEFEITMRTDKTPTSKIIKILPTGTKLEVVERDEEAGYAYVKTGAGQEGWVLSRYLIDEPIAKIRLQSAERRMQDMKESIARLEKEVDALSKTKSELEKENLSLSRNSEKLGKEMETIRKVSAKPLALNEENESLKSQLLTMRREMQSLQQENSQLQDQSARNWFLIGAGVCVVGILVGLVLPNLRMRKKTSWSSL